MILENFHGSHGAAQAARDMRCVFRHSTGFEGCVERGLDAILVSLL